MSSFQPKAPEPISPKYRAKRKPRHVVPAEDIPISELERHYHRLCRVGRGGIWKRAFLGIAVLLAGGVVGAVLAGPGWTTGVKVAALISFISFIAWWAVQETEAEGINNIREDFKEDILDSIELEVMGQDHEEFSAPEIITFFNKLRPSDADEQG